MSNDVNISAQTIEVLQSFEMIRSSIMFRKGNFLNTSVLGMSTIAEYQCEETFPETFGIYELGQFLKGLSLFSQPTLSFDGDNYLTIRNDSGRERSAKYFYTPIEMVEDASPKNKLKFPEEDVVVDFNLSESNISALWKASSVYGIADVEIAADEDEQVVRINLWDEDNDTANTFSIVVFADVSRSHSVHMKVSSLLCLLRGDYRVSITDGIITRWKKSNLDLVYYISIEDDE